MSGLQYPRPNVLRKTSPEDLKQAATVKSAGDAVIACIRRILEKEPQKPLRALNRVEIDHLATAAIEGWVLKRNEIETGELNDQIHDLLI